MALPVPDRTAAMSAEAKIGEAMRRSVPYLPGDAGRIVLQMLEPASLAIIAGTLVIWAGSHFFGVGEVVDLILLCVGVMTLGLSTFAGARLLLDFAKTAINARSDRDLDTAARLFAQAATILGISVIQAVLLHGQARTAIARGQPRIYPRIQVGPPPPATGEPWLSRPASIPGSLGDTDAYGVIRISRDQPLNEQRITLYHELVHRYFSPRTGPFRQFRAELSMSAYQRSALLQYLEEALAEGHGQLRVNGLAAALRAYRFPLSGGYVTLSQLATEGAAIGAIVLGGTLFHVTISLGPIPGPQ